VAETSVHTRGDLVTTFGPVRLSVPPDPSLSRVARLAASGLASLAGCTVDEIEDIKIAVSEVLIALIEHGDGARVDLEFDLEFEVEGEGKGEVAGASTAGETASGTVGASAVFVVRGSSPVSSLDLDHPDLVLCRTVLAGVCASSEIELVDGQARITAIVARTELG